MFEVGDVIGSYTILAHLRTGGMADLFLAHREGAAGFRRLVAVKVIHPRLAEDPQLAQMFVDEALITARIDHPNVVHVEDLGEVNDTYFLVMEYVHGSSLAQLMKVLGQQYRRLSPIVAVAIATRVAEGLHAAHLTTDEEGQLVGLVHRDVSPQNILLSHKGHVKLIDFGVAKARLRSQETQIAMLKGKVRYMAPEQATTGEVDQRSDIYALGIVLWEMLTMRRLFAGTTEFEVLMNVRDPKILPPSTYVPDLPPEVDDVVLAALAKDPDDRPPSAKVLRRMLAAALPRSMALDSAHLADLMDSVVGDELERVRHELPDEISRILEAESLRVLAEERAADRAVDSMTVHSDMVSFEEDELDDTPEVTDVIRQARESGAIPLASVAAAAPTSDFPAPGEEDQEPTVVGGVHEDLEEEAGHATIEDVPGVATTPHIDPAQLDGSPLAATDTRAEIPEPLWENAPTEAVPSPHAAAPAASPGVSMPAWGWALAVAASVLVGLTVALVLAALLGEDPMPKQPSTSAPPAVDAGAPDAGAPDAGAEDAGRRRRRPRRRRRRR